VLAGLEALQMDDSIFRPRAGGGPRVAVANRPTNTGRRFASHPPHGPCGDDAVAQDKEGPGQHRICTRKYDAAALPRYRH